MPRSFVWLMLAILLVLRITFHFLGQDKIPNGTLVKISDQVLMEPIHYEYSQGITLQGYKFYLPLYPEVNYGDEIQVEGIVGDGELRDPVMKRMEKDKGLIFALRNRLIKFYQRALPQPHSSLIAGMTMGSKSDIPKGFWESLKKSGTAHVVVASGMNVTLVVNFLMNFLAIFMKRKKAIVFALSGIWFYTVISGFDAPIVRAAIMASIAFSAQAMGRVAEAWRGFLLSAGVMLLFKPEWISDLGFQLSFVATGSLMLFEERVRRYIRKFPSFFQEGLSTSLAAQIGVAPILFVTFGQFNPLSPLINALVLWTVAPITVIGMVAAMFSLVSVHFARLILLISYPLTFWFINIVNLLS